MANFFFAWADPDETVFGHEHYRKDVAIKSFVRSHLEGNFPTLSIDVQNPQIGLLAPGRKVWAWLSFQDDTGHVKPIFFGRLVGIPTNMIGPIVTLSFIAKALDFREQKIHLAAALRAPPFDYIWVDANLADDADSVLEFQSALWHFDPIDLSVSISDIIVGEDGDEIFERHEIPRDSVIATLGQTPLTAIEIDAKIGWTQVAYGDITLNPGTFEGEGLETLIKNWPKPGTLLGAGWSVKSASATDFYGLSNSQNLSGTYHYDDKNNVKATGETLTIDHSWSYPDFLSLPGINAADDTFNNFGNSLGGKFTIGGGMSFRQVFTAYTSQIGECNPDSDPPRNIPRSFSGSGYIVPTWNAPADLTISYAAKRSRTERIRFVLAADMQAILSLPESPNTYAGLFNYIKGDTFLADDTIWLVLRDHVSSAFFNPLAVNSLGYKLYEQMAAGIGTVSDHEKLVIPGRNVDAVMPDHTVPIGDPSRSSFFTIARGRKAIEGLLAIARSHLLFRSRAVQVQFNCTFERALNLSCRKNARLYDPRLPGGTALGKIISYDITGNVQTGAFFGTVTIGCAIGYGNSITEQAGVPVYVNPGYVTDGYQINAGETIVLSSGDIGYTIPVDAVTDDGLRFPLSKRNIISESKDGGIYSFELPPVVNGPFSREYDLTVTRMTIPQQINLEAPSSP